MAKKILRVISYMITVSYVTAQLNFPPIPEIPESKAEIYSYSYTPKKSSSSDDESRSQRFGPPYIDRDDYRPSDYRATDNNNRDQASFNRDRNNSLYERYPVNRYSNNNSNRFPLNGRNTDYRYTTDRPVLDDRYYNNRFPDDNNFPTTDRYPINRYPSQNPFNNNNNFENNYNNNNGFNDRFRYDQERRNSYEMEKIRAFLTDIDQRGSAECTANVIAQWNFETDLNEITQADAILAQQRYSDFQKSIYNEIKKIDKNNLFDENLYRQLYLLSNVGPNALEPDQLDRYNRLINDMLTIYNNAMICAYDQPFQCDFKLNPDIKDIMARSRDWDELQYVWTEFNRKSGKPMRDLFVQLIDLMNDVSSVNNFTNAGEYWFSGYDSFNFRDEIELIWSEIQPLYDLIHAYVRRRLREYYGPDKINRNAPIPSHILGNVYGQTWTNILELIIPYPGRNFIDVTQKMVEQGYSPIIMFQLADEFFLSLNMSALTPEFWINSIIEQPNRPVLCQPSAWDFCNKRDFRIKMCTQVNHKDLITVHHEMTHIQYFTSYKYLPKVFRDGANPGFHEAIGDAIGLSVATPKHLQTLGLVQKSIDDSAYDINYLLAVALDKVVFLPFALALENWRYDVFSKRVNNEEMNCHFWYLRELYGGIKPPVLRTEMDFDPGSKYHTAANVPYLKYFVGTVLQFQIYRAMCRASRQYDTQDPQKALHKCDIYRQPEAGKILRKLMEKGASKHWKQVLEEVIGEGRLDGSALRDYFRPLEEWLRNENLRNQEFIGWTYDGDYCKRSIETANLQVYGGFYNECYAIKSNIITVIVMIHIIILINFYFPF